MVATRFSSYGSRICIVKIGSYEKQNPRGSISNPTMEETVHFDNLTQMLLAMESFYDELNSPQRTMRPRGFAKERAENEDSTESESDEKVLATFKINVMFRQNASWQGNLMWLETKQEAQFRSALEMIMIIDSAFALMNRQPD